MSFQHQSPANFRVDHSYENEFALAASAEIVGILAFALILTSLMPELPWAFVPTTTGPDENGTFIVTVEEFSLWTQSCSTPGMEYTFNSNLCTSRYYVVQAFSVMATILVLLGCIFGIMPFSPVAPREPKVALTHSMLSHMFASLFALISWAVFYGGLVFGVFQHVNPEIAFNDFPWNGTVTVTSGGIVAVSGWCASFFAWVLSLSAMIKYDSSAAEQAIIEHKRKKEDRRRRKAELIERLGEGAARAAREGIALELGDKLYLGGTIAAGGVSAIAWMNNGMTPYLLQSPHALPQTAAASVIINVVASTVGAIVLLIGLSDLVPRPKASVGGFSVFSLVTVLFVCNFGMIIAFLRRNYDMILPFEIAVGTMGMCFSIATTIVLYHPFKIWEKAFTELPRPAKIHKGKHGKALVNTAAVCCLLAFGFSCAAVTIYLLDNNEFIGRVPTEAPTQAGDSWCTNNVEGALCSVGPPEQRCCVPPLECVETAFTRFTCEYPLDDFIVGIRDSYSVAQAFLAIFIVCATIAYVFAAIALTPNGVMDVSVALCVTYAIAFVGTACGVIAFAVLQGYVLNAGLSGMPRECGYLAGGFVAELIGAVCALFAWLPYHQAEDVENTNELKEAQREHELERLRLETLQFKLERLRLENTGGLDNVGDVDGNKDENGVTAEGDEEEKHDTPTVTAMDLQQM